MANKSDMTYEESVEVFPLWIARMRRHFMLDNRGYNATEAALLARLAGFDPMFVHQTFSHYDDVLAGTNIDHRAIRKVRKAEDWLLAFSGLGLGDAWRDLGEHLTKGTDWGDDDWKIGGKNGKQTR